MYVNARAFRRATRRYISTSKAVGRLTGLEEIAWDRTDADPLEPGTQRSFRLARDNATSGEPVRLLWLAEDETLDVHATGLPAVIDARLDSQGAYAFGYEAAAPIADLELDYRRKTGEFVEASLSGLPANASLAASLGPFALDYAASGVLASGNLKLVLDGAALDATVIGLPSRLVADASSNYGVGNVSTAGTGAVGLVDVVLRPAQAGLAASLAGLRTGYYGAYVGFDATEATAKSAVLRVEGLTDASWDADGDQGRILVHREASVAAPKAAFVFRSGATNATANVSRLPPSFETAYDTAQGFDLRYRTDAAVAGLDVSVGTGHERVEATARNLPLVLNTTFAKDAGGDWVLDHSASAPVGLLDVTRASDSASFGLFAEAVPTRVTGTVAADYSTASFSTAGSGAIGSLDSVVNDGGVGNLAAEPAPFVHIDTSGVAPHAQAKIIGLREASWDRGNGTFNASIDANLSGTLRVDYEAFGGRMTAEIEEPPSRLALGFDAKDGVRYDADAPTGAIRVFTDLASDFSLMGRRMTGVNVTLTGLEGNLEVAWPEPATCERRVIVSGDRVVSASVRGSMSLEKEASSGCTEGRQILWASSVAVGLLDLDFVAGQRGRPVEPNHLVWRDTPERAEFGLRLEGLAADPPARGQFDMEASRVLVRDARVVGGNGLPFRFWQENETTTATFFATALSGTTTVNEFDSKDLKAVIDFRAPVSVVEGGTVEEAEGSRRFFRATSVPLGTMTMQALSVSGRAYGVQAFSNGGTIGRVETGVSFDADNTKYFGFSSDRAGVHFDLDLDGDTRYGGNPHYAFGSSVNTSNLMLRGRYGDVGFGIGGDWVALGNFQIKTGKKDVGFTEVPSISTAGEIAIAPSPVVQLYFYGRWFDVPVSLYR